MAGEDFDDALRAELEAAAERDRRPIGNLVRVVLADWIEAKRASQDGERRGATA